MSDEKLPDVAPMKAQATDLMTQTRALKIVDDATFQLAAELAKCWRALTNEITAKFANPKKLAHEAHRAITSLESELLAVPRNGEQIIKLAIGNYHMEQEKIRRAEEARLADEARKRREEAQLQEAMELEAAGEKEQAEDVVSRPVEAPIVSLPKPKAAGVSTAMVWTFEIVDATKLKPAFLVPNEQAIRQVVNAMKDNAHEALGGGAVRIFQQAQVRVGR